MTENDFTTTYKFARILSLEGEAGSNRVVAGIEFETTPGKTSVGDILIIANVQPREKTLRQRARDAVDLEEAIEAERNRRNPVKVNRSVTVDGVDVTIRPWRNLGGR